MVEAWLPIPQYPGYEASDLGRIRSLDRTIVRHSYGRQIVARRKGKILTPSVGRNGYPKVEVAGASESVHRLVLAAFVGPCPAGYEGAHGDGNRLNAALNNLRYATRTENAADRHRHGTTNRGSKVYGAKLSATDVLEIRALATTTPHKALAVRYGVSRPAISYAVRGDTWGHV